MKRRVSGFSYLLAVVLTVLGAAVLLSLLRSMEAQEGLFFKAITDSAFPIRLGEANVTFDDGWRHRVCPSETAARLTA